MQGYFHPMLFSLFCTCKRFRPVLIIFAQLQLCLQRCYLQHRICPVLNYARSKVHIFWSQTIHHMHRGIFAVFSLQCNYCKFLPPKNYPFYTTNSSNKNDHQKHNLHSNQNTILSEVTINYLPVLWEALQLPK